MARYGDFITGVLTSEVLDENDLRAFFPIQTFPLPAEEAGENLFDPEIMLTFREAVELVYRVRRIRVVINLVADGTPITDDVIQWMYPTPTGVGDERDIPKLSYGSAPLGFSEDGVLVGTSIGIRSYRPSTQEFQAVFAWNSGFPWLLTTTNGPDYIATGGVLRIFGAGGHTAPINWINPGAVGSPVPVVTGDITVSHYDYREYRKADGSDPLWHDSSGSPLIIPTPGGIG